MADEKIPSREQALAKHARSKGEEHLNKATYWFDLAEADASNLDLQLAGAYFAAANEIDRRISDGR